MYTIHLLGVLSYLAIIFAVIAFTPASRSRHDEPQAAENPYCIPADAVACNDRSLTLGEGHTAPVNTGAIWPGVAWEKVKTKTKTNTSP